MSKQSEHQSLTEKLQNKVFAIKTYTLRNLDMHTRNQVEETGTDLWNLCTRKRRNEGERTSTGYCRVLLLARIYAFLLLALPDAKAKKQPHAIVRILRLAIKTGRSCIGKPQLYPPDYLCMHTRLKPAQRAASSSLRFVLCKKPRITTACCMICRASCQKTN